VVTAPITVGTPTILNAVGPNIAMGVQEALDIPGERASKKCESSNHFKLEVGRCGTNDGSKSDHIERREKFSNKAIVYEKDKIPPDLYR
jgi:hypothetical protein